MGRWVGVSGDKCEREAEQYKSVRRKLEVYFFTRCVRCCRLTWAPVWSRPSPRRWLRRTATSHSNPRPSHPPPPARLLAPSTLVTVPCHRSSRRPRTRQWTHVSSKTRGNGGERKWDGRGWSCPPDDLVMTWTWMFFSLAANHAFHQLRAAKNLCRGENLIDVFLVDWSYLLLLRSTVLLIMSSKLLREASQTYCERLWSHRVGRGWYQQEYRRLAACCEDRCVLRCLTSTVSQTVERLEGNRCCKGLRKHLLKELRLSGESYFLMHEDLISTVFMLHLWLHS